MTSRLIYTLLLLLLMPWALLHLLWRARRQPDYLCHWGERFGYYADVQAPPQEHGKSKLIWLHAVSVGETRAAQPLVALLRERFPDHRILFTHMTPTGRQTSESLFCNTVDRVYLPYDYPWAVHRFIRHFRPAVGVIMETEIWPNLVSACREAKIPLILANARLSQRSARRYALFTPLARAALQCLTAVGAQSETDAARLAALGARNISITGNMKFDIDPPPAQLELGAHLRRGYAGRPVLLAASTREGEEVLLLDALRANPIPDLLLVVVPRHPQRFDEVAALIVGRGFRLQRRSEDVAVANDTEVLLGDSMGEMFAYYASCDVAIIGGSLLDYGSQNLIEACAVGVAVLVGPSTYNFAQAAEQAIACGAALQVADAPQAIATAAILLGNDESKRQMAAAGRAFAAQHRGASHRTLNQIIQAMH